MGRSWLKAVLVVLVAWTTAAVWAAEPDLPTKVREAMQDRNFPVALQAIDEAAKVKDAPADYLAYLKGRALHLAKQYDEAVAAYEVVEKQSPKSEWARRARFGKAVSLMRKGDFRSAEVIYRDEAVYLLSLDRKQEIAGIYLEFADSYFKPADPDQKPDYTKALNFYSKALEVGPKPEKRAEVELLVAQCHQQLKNLPQAATLYAKFSKDHASSPLDVEARFRLGECQLGQGQLKEARRTWEDLLAAYAANPSERIAEAAFNLSRTYQIPQPGSNEDLSLGVASLESFLERFPLHKLASQAHLAMAQSYIHRGRFEDAVTCLKRFLADARYQDREEVPEARNLLGRSYQLQKKFPEALETWREYLTKHPTHSAWSAVQRELVNTEYLMAQEKRAAKSWDEARKLWSDFLAKYPLDGRAATILFEFGSMNHQQEKWNEAIADWRRLVSKYPNTNESSQGQFMIAATLEEKLGKLEEALKEYQKLNWGGRVGEAQQRIAQLTAQSMSVATERVFRSDETPKLKLVTRNIESVTVRAYTVDLETYFRKMHLAQGVEGLDIALIDPDKTFEFKVPKYAKYQQLESAVEVPLPAGPAKPGVMAVTVTSKTLETTTLVIQSDLDVIVKSSRDEVFVFAENLRTGKPWPKARLLVSNGNQVFAEGATGDDGVFQKSFEELKNAGDVRVFAVADGNVASNVVGLEGVGVAKGLADKGYIYTDRPAYRAGQMVHVRGCLRAVSGDAYTIQKGKKYTLEVFDPRNRLVRQDKAELSEFGSFHANFVLPTTSPQGQYRVQVRDEDRRSYQGSFIVHEYQLEPVRIVVDTARKVFYRGEEIEGKIAVSFYYGAPLVGREIQYKLADERVYTAKTDAKGEVAFKLPTREFREAQVLPLVVTLPERNLQTSANFFLATQGFSISVTSVRPVYVAGETFEAAVKAIDAEGKPVAEKLALSVLEQTTVEGKVGERLVEKHDLQTAADGTVRQTLRMEKGARYVLRAAGTDRFKNPIAGENIVEVSDDKDTVRLRILADKHTFKAGDNAAVQIHWREEPALALVTFQGAKVLEYRLVQLQKGANALPITMTANLAPNFELSVAVMTDGRVVKTVASAAPAAPVTPTTPAEAAKVAPPAAQPAPNAAPVAAQPAPPAPTVVAEPAPPVRRFHEATSPFAVERDLRVAIATKRQGDAKSPLRPGEPIEISVTTTDPQGKPVSAEVSLAMVEQSLLERFNSPLASIQDFFRGGARQTAVRTTSSITFAYQPATQAIDPHLLAEKDRLEIAADEAAARARLAVPRGGAAAAPGAQPATPPPPTVAATEEAVPEAAPEMEYPELAVQAQAGAMEGGGGGMGGMAGGWQELGQQARQNRVMLGVEVNGAADSPQQQAAARQRSSGSSFGRRAMVRSGAVAANGPAAGQDFTYFDAGDAVRADDTRHYALNANGNDWYVAPNAKDLGAMVAQNRKQVAVLWGDGSMQNLDVVVAMGDPNDVAKVQALADSLNKAGAVLLPDFGPQETGYWNPSIVTDKEGKATVQLTVPERSTAWKFLAKGITAETLAGEATGEATVKKDLFGELKLPLAFIDGDDAEILVSVHNDAVDKGTVEVTLKTTLGGKTVEEKKTLEVTAKGIQELAFKTQLRRPEGQQAPAAGGPETAVTLELTVAADKLSDLVRRTIPLQPYGMPVFASAGGSASSDTTAWIEPLKDMPMASPALQVIVGPSVERSLLDVVLAPAPLCQMEYSRIASGLDSSVSDLLAALGLQTRLGKTREAGGPEAEALDGRIRSALSLLVSSQNDDGGWSWTGRGGASDRYSSAQAVWAMSLAKAAGYTVPQDAFDKATAFLQGQIAAARNDDYESHAIMLHALAAAGRGDFALANRLHRDRLSLSSAALARLALAFAEMDRKPMAQEILTLLAERNLDETTPDAKSAVRVLPWSHAAAELRALYALALVKISPEAAKTKELVDWLLANRTGYRWSPDKATGPATLALCEWFAKSKFEADRYKLTVFVNDNEAKVLDIDQTSGTQTIDVPAALLVKGKQRINFQITGRGRYTYQCVLGGFVPADQLKSTCQDWEVRRHFEPAPLELDGQTIPRGFGVLQGSYTTFRNPLTQLPVGQRGQVELEIYRRLAPDTPDERLEYLVITEPLPSGATVIEKSVQGGFDRFEISPGAITFYVGGRRNIGAIRYEIHGYLPGAYRAAPTVIRNAYRPEQLVVAQAQALAVLPLGAKSTDVYRLTPQELYELGKRQFAKRDFKAAGENLSELFAKWNLQPEVYKDTARMLLDVHLETGPANQVVRYFEIVKEKWPDLEVSFDKIVKVGAAYHEMGEYERSYLIFRATVESSFLRESGVAGFLDAQGEFLRSVEVMGRLLREYPPEPYVAAATYALAQRVYAKAPEAAADAKLREKKINRVDLVRQAQGMLEGFLTAYPEDPAADQASFSLANALLELKSFKEAIAACNRYAGRYPSSDYLDSYWYVIGYCHFALGEHQQALEMCRKVSEAKRAEPGTGRQIESPNKWRAIYILGQVHHSLGEAAQAIQEYTRVADRFIDAKQAIEYFSRKEIALPEVTMVKPGQPADLELKFRNVAACDAKVYRIDLMKFSLLKRNLGGITKINLAGIRPYHEATIQLGDGKDYRDRTQKLTLPLKEEGAYLVVCRGDDLHASGLVLVTPLAVEVQEEGASGRVRTTVKDQVKDRYLSDVHVKVIGSRNPDFVSGQTDLRGVFVADAILGTSTVIAQAEGGRYAFFRGQVELGPPPAPPAPAEASAAGGMQSSSSKPSGKARLESDLLEGLQKSNSDIQQLQQRNLKGLYDQNKQGVKASEAY
ncbi:MAG: tetratricopeptide repeat protein [Pirellulales bacterium]